MHVNSDQLRTASFATPERKAMLLDGHFFSNLECRLALTNRFSHYITSSRASTGTYSGLLLACLASPDLPRRRLPAAARRPLGTGTAEAESTLPEDRASGEAQGYFEFSRRTFRA